MVIPLNRVYCNILFTISFLSALSNKIFSSSALTTSVERGLCMYFRTLCLCLIASSIVMISIMNCACKVKKKTIFKGKKPRKISETYNFL